jgi:hypothetical protein
MCDFDTSVSVWTHNSDPAWLAKNAGCTDVLMITGISRVKADGLAARLIEMGHTEVEIRDIHNVCVWATDHLLVGLKRDARLREPVRRPKRPRVG